MGAPKPRGTVQTLFKKNFPKLTEGKDSSAIRKIMIDMGYGSGSGLRNKMKSSKGKSNFAMGGEVMDTTKSMPVGMMDGGKVKPMKMNMGGVVPGRGGKFKGVM